jgi:hypothetical protein
MLKKEKPTLSPNRFTAKGLRSLLEAVSAKETEKKVTRGGGGGFSNAEKMPEKGFGSKGGSGLEPLSANAAKYTSALPLGFYRAGLGLQQADFVLSQMPLGMGQLASMAAISAALPQTLRFAGLGKAADEAESKVSEYEGESVSPNELDLFGVMEPEESEKKTKSLQAKTIKYGDKEISVTPDSLQYKLSDPYKVKPFVDYAKRLKQQEKEMLDLGKRPMPTQKF